MSNITTRASKGSILTYKELDDNFITLYTELLSRITSPMLATALANEVLNRTTAINNEVTLRNSAITSAVTNETNDRINALAAEIINRDIAINQAVVSIKDNVSTDGDTLAKLFNLINSAAASSETTISIKNKLGITILSGDNTGDQTLLSLGIPDVENKSSLTIRSEITTNDVITALGYTPLNIISNLVTNEVVAGITDGVNVDFTVANVPLGLFQLFMNGILLEPGIDNDYLINGNAITITMLIAPLPGFKLRAYYVK